MLTEDYELYYFDDILLNHVSVHSHDYYELYFFLEGSVDYVINDITYHLSNGDFLIIPPGIQHHPLFKKPNYHYRRFVLWINENFINSIAKEHPDIFYTFQFIKEQENYLIHVSDSTFQDIQARFIHILEEMKNNELCYQLECTILVVSLLIHINRIIYNEHKTITSATGSDLHINLCNYINMHLESDLSLNSLSDLFFLSKYHISHVFKEQMGISIYQYILQKRLIMGKNCILSGIPISQVHLHCGFHNYSSFFRTFKKEFGISPKDFLKNHIR